MEYEYTGRHVEVTPALRRHVEEHFDKIDHLFEGSTTARAHIIIEVNKNRQTAEILFHWREHTLTAKDTNADMYQALTRCIDKIEKQAVRLKKKIIERRQSGAPLSALAPDTTAPGDGAADGADGGGARGPRIINARRYRVKPMTAEEAMLALSEDASQFLVFRDADTDGLSVIYKRKDGNYGLIQP